MAIECKRCGGPAMLETVIKLRRGFLGFRETRWQGAYCASCRLSAPIDNHATLPGPIAINRNARKLAPMWMRAEPGGAG